MRNACIGRVSTRAASILAILGAALLASCGGGVSPDSITAASARDSQTRPRLQQRAAAGPSAAVLYMYQALLGGAPGHADLESQTLSAQDNLGAYVVRFEADHSGQLSHAALAALVLKNVGVTNAAGLDAAGYNGLLAAVTQLLAANPAARGVVVYQLCDILIDKQADPTYGAAARAFNTQLGNNVLYLSDTANTQSTGLAPASQWQIVSYPKQVWNEVRYLNGKFFALGASGAVLVSSDGMDWAAKPGPWGMLSAITYGDAGYVAVGPYRTVFKSVDGETWTRTTPIPTPQGGILDTADYADVTFGKGAYVAVGLKGISRSTDGITWTVVQSSARPGRVSFGNGRFVATGANGAALSSIYTSDDGITWKALANPAPPFGANGLFDGQRFVMTRGDGTLYTSADGLAWQLATSSAPAGTLSYVNGQYFMRSTSGIQVSSDAVAWAPFYTYANNIYNGVPVIAASPQRYVLATANTLSQGSDGKSWAATAQGPSADLNGVDAMNGRWVAVGGAGTLLTSSDGLQWRPASTSFPANAAPYFTAVTHGNGRFVATSGQGLYSSSDGDTWTLATGNRNATLASLSAVTFGNGRFAAVGTSGGPFTSTDGQNWENPPVNFPSTLRAVTYGNNLFVAAGEAGILSSTDGLAWPRNASAVTTYATVAYGGGRFLATTLTNNNVWSSTNGLAWTYLSLTEANLKGLVYVDNQFMAVANGDNLAVSPDGTRWQTSTLGVHPGLGLNAMAMSGNTLVVVGAGGTILASKR